MKNRFKAIQGQLVNEVKCLQRNLDRRVVYFAVKHSLHRHLHPFLLYSACQGMYHYAVSYFSFQGSVMPWLPCCESLWAILALLHNNSSKGVGLTFSTLPVRRYLSKLGQDLIVYSMNNLAVGPESKICIENNTSWWPVR